MDLLKLSESQRKQWAEDIISRMKELDSIGIDSSPIFTEAAVDYSNMLAGVIGSINAMEAPMAIAATRLLTDLLVEAFPESNAVYEHFYKASLVKSGVTFADSPWQPSPLSEYLEVGEKGGKGDTWSQGS